MNAMGKWRTKAVMAAALAAGGLAVSTGSVSATPLGEDITVVTADVNRGGRATWHHNRDWLQVCDDAADGRRVAARIDDKEWMYEVRGKGKCSEFDQWNLPEGKKVRVTVCLQDGPAGKKYACTTGYGQAVAKPRRG
ncbi:hypothetical protein ACFVGY_12710 [Streptomyces sp. NPDC127106]|uniref:hypothetical protein n=1 Tax=Streptomyces sp. NPDC127106 TaxID=3345360 RepID=UPI00363B0E89